MRVSLFSDSMMHLPSQKIVTEYLVINFGEDIPLAFAC